MQANACPFRSANHPCTSSCPSENCRIQGPTRAPTAPTLTANMRKNIKEVQEASPTLWHAIPPPVISHQDAPSFSPSVLPRGDECPSLPARIDTAHASPALTETAAPNPAAPADVRSSKRNANHARSTDVQTASPSPSADQESDVTSVASTGESDGESDYFESAKNAPTILANTPELAGKTSKLEEMHKVIENDLV